jgi:uncharacterized protein (DUF2141 family)
MKMHFKSSSLAATLLFCSIPILVSAHLSAQAAPATAPAPAPAAAPTAAAAKPAEATTTLTVRVTGIRNSKGRIGVVLFKDGVGFPMDRSAIVAARRGEIDPQTLVATVVFENLPQGAYAAAVLHDDDLSGQMSFDSQGIPTKGYGISNNPPSQSGPPTADEAKFTVNQPESAIEIKMVYWQ